MSGLMRSEPMSYLQLLVPEEAALQFCNELGHASAMQFVDLNEGVQAFQRRYMKDIVRISDIERKVKNIEGFLKSHNIEYDDYLNDEMIQHRANDRDIVDKLENEVNQIYKGLTGDIKVENELQDDLKKAEDFEEVLSRTEQFLGHQQEARVALHENKQDHFDDGPSDDTKSYIMDQPLLNLKEQKTQEPTPQIGRHGIAFKYFAGVVTDAQRPAFERQVYLASRGNTYSLFNDIPGRQKSTFVVFLLGQHLSDKLDRLAKFMNIEVFLTTETSQDIDKQLSECRQHQEDVKHLLQETKRGLERNLYQVAKDVMEWRVTLMQEKAIRYTLNRFKDSERANILIAEGWCPTSKKHEVEDALNSATAGKGMAPSVLSDIAWKGKPPTYFKLNKFTAAFQNIVNTYGVPRYQEINPAIFTIITFPFLYAMMYGDVFHGSCVFAYALYLIYKEKQMEKQRLNDFIGAAFYGRYVLLLMGAFAIYMGFIYNDMASIPLHWAESGWLYDGKTIDQGFPIEPHGEEPMISVEQGVQKAHVYPFGIDFAWYGTDQELSFFNGFKMKAAIIVAVTQMTFGLFLSLANHIHFKDHISIWCEFLPQLIFIMCTFGYMCFLILYKWWVNWACRGPGELQAPNIIAVMIDYALSPGSLKDEAQMFPNGNFQRVFEEFILILALISIPWMLFPKPILLNRKYKKQHEVAAKADEVRSQMKETFGDMPRDTRGQSMYQFPKDSRGISMSTQDGFRRRESFVDDDDLPSYGAVERNETVDLDNEEETMLKPQQQSFDSDEEHGFSFGEVFIHQIIHTIEYVLGTISNTASYLRLWALSLAHAELSKVIFEQIMQRFLEDGSFFLIFVGAPAFYVVTFAVLLTMDVLECFLHALRLHWVEWQNKFYSADGEIFAPFSYQAVLEEEREG